MGTELFSLEGKRALVTGANRGIGRAIAEGLAVAGGEVAILARDKDKLKEAKAGIEKVSGKKVWMFEFDLEETEKIDEAFENITSQAGQIDILVNCAGLNIRAKAEEMDIEAWERVHKVNLTAAFVLSQGFCRYRKKVGRGGRIINIGSLMCHGARPSVAAYASSKGALLMLTRSLAVEWAQYNINVNAIGPGYIATELTAGLRADEDFDRWVLSRTPLERWGQPGDIAGAAVFFASAASDFITGQIIYVDGGWVAAV